jgi:hypothetical protein
LTWANVAGYKREGRAALAQLVEQRTENPCVLGSIPRGGKPTAPLFQWERGVLYFRVNTSSITASNNNTAIDTSKKEA